MSPADKLINLRDGEGKQKVASAMLDDDHVEKLAGALEFMAASYVGPEKNDLRSLVTEKLKAKFASRGTAPALTAVSLQQEVQDEQPAASSASAGVRDFDESTLTLDSMLSEVLGGADSRGPAPTETQATSKVAADKDGLRKLLQQRRAP